MTRGIGIGILLAYALLQSAFAFSRPIDDQALPKSNHCTSEYAGSKGYRELAACEARRAGLPAHVAMAVMEIESGFNPVARGAAGEVGLMQVMPATARMLGFQGNDDDLAQPEINIKLGVKYLAKAHRLAGGDLCTTVMKYRAGHGETRFSARSVAYCVRARQILGRDGHALAGKVPAINLGGAGAIPSLKASGASGVSSCVRRILVPGPRFKQCAEYRAVKVTRLKLW